MYITGGKDLFDLINETNVKDYAGKIFRHFKGDLYLFIDIAIHSETNEKMVVYKALYGKCEIFVRPLSMFLSEVDREKYPDIKQKYRFEPFEVESINHNWTYKVKFYR